jgi:hypothetical protein
VGPEPIALTSEQLRKKEPPATNMENKKRTATSFFFNIHLKGKIKSLDF